MVRICFVRLLLNFEILKSLKGYNAFAIIPELIALLKLALMVLSLIPIVAGYFGSICASDFGLLVPGISV